ncbi:cytochrome b/b6 domain-containing protein [Thermoproteus tenax]|uniref:Formate dehydrogenase cytochrome b subunit n=1 Tax=Thermoproteus tenax (strain ATCC 35583 / DSM 2078 / JCM 9277 / NBRC 100435 / Kra 1) TaxID=768679 RepID=G4RJU6_THETK|nr:cytochrome b/b6 domain-containing protein [Thermoproteus tenax]CCC81841.1 formate dehydrogenase cytochrome b subunit [Thermoproteus tenax Kra 1]
MSSVNYEKKNIEEVEVISVGYKVAHSLNLVLFTLLAVTGAMLLFPDLMSWLSYAVGAPLASLLGNPYPVSIGEELARTSHRFLGELWGLFLIIYAIYLLAFKRIRVFDALKRPLGQQIREARALVDHYVFGKPLPNDVAENLERHNVLVAYMAIELVASILLLSISGVLMVYANILGLTIDEYRILLLLHDLGFYLGLIFIFAHLFAVLHPTNRPLLLAMFGYGKIPLSWAQRHMPKYLKYVKRSTT